jgi:dihydrofolate reductase
MNRTRSSSSGGNTPWYHSTFSGEALEQLVEHVQRLLIPLPDPETRRGSRSFSPAYRKSRCILARRRPRLPTPRRRHVASTNKIRQYWWQPVYPIGRYSLEMRPLRYSINLTLDGCCDHRAIPADEDLHRHAVENLNQADALLFGRVTYEMMESAWQPPATGARPDWMETFAQTINAAKKYVVSSTLEQVDWNAELVRGDLGKAVQELKRESGKGLFMGGVKLPLALTELGLIDEYEFVVHPRLAGHGPTLFAGLSKHVDLKLVSRLEFGSGAVAMRYEPRR